MKELSLKTTRMSSTFIIFYKNSGMLPIYCKQEKGATTNEADGD